MNDSTSAKDKRRFATRLKEARIGDQAAQYDVALMFANGVGVSKSVAHAFTWAKAAAEKGHVGAQYLLGIAYSGGLGTHKDEQRALSWFLKAHERGSEKAAFKLARVMALEQPVLAFRFALEAAEKGLAEAQVAVADSYTIGAGVDADAGQSLYWYQRAAEQGASPAQYALGQCLEKAASDYDYDDHAEARQWYRAAAKAGHPGAQLALDRLDKAGYGRNGQVTKSRSGGRERRISDSRWIQYAAHGGTDDFYHLGMLYEQGVSVDRNLKQARVWYRKAAELGHVKAQFSLACSFEQSDFEQAKIWMLRAAQQGHPQAQYAVGQMCLRALSGAQDKLDALVWFAEAAQQGNATAQFALGGLLKKDADGMAHTAITQAASGGYADAQYAMGERYRHGTGVAKNWLEACRWYQMAAEQDHAQAQCALAGCYAEGKGAKKDLAHAFAWYEKAAAQNLPKAQWNLGELYATGIPGLEADAKKAMMLCKRAANAGFAPAQATLGALFARAKKNDRAVHWWSMAAEQGDLEALFNMGQAYRLGLGVEKDESRAFAMLLRAGEGGLAAAQSRLGLAYATGQGVALDPIEAAKWFELAALGGDTAAAANWTNAKRTLSPAQRTESERRTQEWLRYRGSKV